MVAALHRPTTSSLTSAISAATHLEAKVPDQVVGSDQLGKGGVVAASSHSASGVSSVAAAQQHISSTTTLVDWQAYVGDHTGFVAAVVVLLLVPVFIFRLLPESRVQAPRKARRRNGGGSKQITSRRLRPTTSTTQIVARNRVLERRRQHRRLRRRRRRRSTRPFCLSTHISACRQSSLSCDRPAVLICKLQN